MKMWFVIEINFLFQQCSLRRFGDDFKLLKIFIFDGVYGILSSMEKIYFEIVCLIVKGVFEGYNGMVFVYG